ncbi:hypothetical protein [Desulfobacter curvatus]|uniref:hypothetical protein n=1 Tax=Desulfobacter curvatus TaxID=2290 RepID=UPI0012F75333|nr:hypothetical protein [Desulfobacter curvatus]
MIRKLVRRGHEVGYHYETLTRAKGDCFLSISLFEEELEMLRRIVNIKTISMHGSPLSKWNNMDIWKFYDYKKYDVDEILLSIAYFNIHYFTDTGRSWERSYNIRDRVGSISPQNSICSTEDLIEYLQFKIEGPVFINVHPNRWTSGFFNLCISIFSDWGINQIKRMISKINGTWNS